jgi:hypothetical protein
MLLKNEMARFSGRSGLVHYHGTHSYLISCLWFGISRGLLAHFKLRHTIFRHKPLALKQTYWLSLVLIATGLIASIWYTINA